MRGFRLALVALGSVVAVCFGPACGPEPAETPRFVVLDEPPPQETVEVARTVTDALGKELVAALFRELESGSAVGAIDVCAVRAQQMTAAYAEQGTRVRRVSRRFRNPANEPDAYESRKLAEFESMQQRGELPTESVAVVLQDGKRTLRYMRPILLKPPCKMCHGPVSEIDRQVLDAIHARYPGDRALGFSVDEVRGAFSVEIDL
ncbi:MAG TPA: DUF3365 domain-containing protein [Candidatus Polarisedimenticolaceae bacterium]|nr:DUF3365 domain-containing protein [Candidatus Polarisedimenticolaceae bacterium]